MFLVFHFISVFSRNVRSVVNRQEFVYNVLWNPVCMHFIHGVPEQTVTIGNFMTTKFVPESSSRAPNTITTHQTANTRKCKMEHVLEVLLSHPQHKQHQHPLHDYGF
eukprot:c15339_g1_i1.p1 GENE.c15339_g1_i1~~c15339_g1_i1.p1  ORF type:complete len:107 (-),score=25.49 c15339_g1_i1:151-471(-)